MSILTKEGLRKKYSFFDKNTLIECMDGWLYIIDELCQSLQDMDTEGLIFTQIKEKNGRLVIYFKEKPYFNLDQYVWEEVQRMLEELEYYSANVCEVCGALGELRRNRIAYKTRCAEHA